MEVLKNYEILLGTYEAFVLGYKLNDEKKPKLQTSIADHAHAASIRCLAASDKFMITAGGDEIVKIFNLRNRTEHGSLTHSEAMINAMKFYDKKYLITCAEDGKVCIIRTGTWKVEKTLLKHTQGVIGKIHFISIKMQILNFSFISDVAVDPSGKLALTIGKDRKLITWNLIKGRSAYVTNIKEIADFVKWSPDGQRFVIGFYKHVDVYSTANASIEYSIRIKGRSNAVEFLNDTTIALAGDMPEIEIHSLTSQEMITKFQAHETRVRCLTYLAPNCLITGSNDGLIKVWQMEEDFKTTLLTSMDTKCRITSMVVHQVPKAQVQEDIKEKVEALVKETKKKRSIGFVELEEPTKTKTSQDDQGPKLVVEVDEDEPMPKKGKKKKPKKAKNIT